MDMLRVNVLSSLYFSVSAPCGEWWQGMRNCDDVRIVIERAMDHPSRCVECSKARTASHQSAGWSERMCTGIPRDVGVAKCGRSDLHAEHPSR